MDRSITKDTKKCKLRTVYEYYKILVMSERTSLPTYCGACPVLEGLVQNGASISQGKNVCAGFVLRIAGASEQHLQQSGPFKVEETVYGSILSPDTGIKNQQLEAMRHLQEVFLPKAIECGEFLETAGHVDESEVVIVTPQDIVEVLKSS